MSENRQAISSNGGARSRVACHGLKPDVFGALNVAAEQVAEKSIASNVRKTKRAQLLWDAG
jgi:hypothetical protein